MSPIVCNADHIKYFINELESKFPFPFRWIDKYTLDGLDVYEKWLDEQKTAVQLKRSLRKSFLQENNLSDNENEDQL